MRQVRESIRQWALLLIGLSGVVYEAFIAKTYDPAKMLLYAAMAGFSRADFVLSTLERITFRFESKYFTASFERPPTIEVEHSEVRREEHPEDKEPPDDEQAPQKPKEHPDDPE